MAKTKKVLFLTLIFGAVIFAGISLHADAQVTSCIGQTDGTVCNANNVSGYCQSGACSSTGSYTLPLDQSMTTANTESTTTTTAATTTTAVAGTVPNGNGCRSDGECQSNNCSMSGADFNDEISAGTCRAIGSSGTPTGGTPGSTTGTPTGGAAGATLSGTGIVIPSGTGLPDPPGGVGQIIRNLLTWLLGIVGVIAIIGFVISGIQYLTSAGNEDMMQSAKRNMLYAIIGVVVVLSSYVIIQAIQYALEARSMF